MTFKIERHLTDWNDSSQREYTEGEELKVRISAALGFDSKPATLEALPEGRGFIVGSRVVRPTNRPNYIWTNKGWAIAT